MDTLAGLLAEWAMGHGLSGRHGDRHLRFYWIHVPVLKLKVGWTRKEMLQEFHGLDARKDHPLLLAIPLASPKDAMNPKWV